MDNAHVILLLVLAAVILYFVLSNKGHKKTEPARVPFIIQDDTAASTAFISPSGGASADFVPVEDDRALYSEFS
jgi:hypothetical protein